MTINLVLPTRGQDRDQQLAEFAKFLKELKLLAKMLVGLVDLNLAQGILMR